MDSQVAPPQGPRSTLVSAIAWIAILMFGTSFLMMVPSVLLINAIVPPDQWQEFANAEQAPALLSLAIENMQLILAAYFVALAAMFVASVGLLRRKNWARITFVCLFVFSILMQFVGLGLFSAVFPWPLLTQETGAPEAQAVLKLIISFFLVIMLASAIAMSAFFGWLIKRLVSREIRAEFVQTR